MFDIFYVWHFRFCSRTVLAWIHSLFFLFSQTITFPTAIQASFPPPPCFSSPDPPHAEVTGYSGDWFSGLRNAALRCVTGGNPAPTITWIRYRRTRLPRCLVLGWLIVWGAWSYISRRFQDNYVNYCVMILPLWGGCGDSRLRSRGPQTVKAVFTWHECFDWFLHSDVSTLSFMFVWCQERSLTLNIFHTVPDQQQGWLKIKWHHPIPLWASTLSKGWLNF